MKKRILLLATLAVLAPCLAVASNAATQVYDLKTDWSDTQNPNGTWSYRQGDSLLINNPFPWVSPNWTWALPTPPVFTKATVTEGDSFAFVEVGDVLIKSINGGNILWTVPEDGTITISGSIWWADWTCGDGVAASWRLSLNGTILSTGDFAFPECGSDYRSSPYQLSLGSGGTAALQNISVLAGDKVVLELNGGRIGLNFTITFTPDSVVDPVAAIKALAITVFEMNLQNGIENSLDSKLDAALNALVDANFNNDGAACNSLAAFINAAEAQRGNKLTDAQADQLVAAAQEIRASLNCGN